MDSQVKMDEDKKNILPLVTTNDEQYLNLKVMSQDGSEISFRIKRQTALKKLMSTFCQKTGMDKNMVKFQFEGERVCDTSTPAKLEMQDGDCIEVFQTQDGGCSCFTKF